MPVDDDTDLSKLEWFEWYSRSKKEFLAYAVDPTSKKRTGTLRAVNGSVVPSYAKPARPETTRDPYCVKVVEQLAARKKRRT